jgi:hypothetical protein
LTRQSIFFERLFEMMDARIKSGHDKPVLAARPARVFHEPCPPKAEGAGKAGCSIAPAASRAVKKAHELVTTGPPKRSGLSCANGFNGFLRALSGDRLFVTIPGAMRSIAAS